VAKEGLPVCDSPGFLELPERERKPRAAGLTHLLDKGAPLELLTALLEDTGELVDVLKLGWGIAYVDRTVKARIAACHAAGVLVSLGGTLLEIAVAQGRLDELRGWAGDQGIDAVEVSNGLVGLTPQEKTALVAELAGEFTVLGETGAKDDRVPVVPERWLAEMEADLDAGARWVIAEGRESGTIGLYHRDGSVREDLVELIAARIPLDRVIFEAPTKAQQAWFITHLGHRVNLGNVPLEEILPLETLRLGLRADTAKLPPRP
jgi:phosphosulfolactate synthase